MVKRHVITLDLGSSGVRAHVVSQDRPWETLAESRVEYRIQGLRGASNVARSFDPRDLGSRIDRAIGDAITAAGVEPGTISTVSVSAQRGGCAFIDQAGQTIYAGPNTDVRAVFQGGALEERLGDQLYEVTGHLPAFMFAPAKLAWHREFHPLKARRVSSIVTLGAWAIHRLTGSIAETGPSLTEAGLADFRTGIVNRRLLDQMQISPDLVPAIVSTGDPAGNVTANAAEATGLWEGTPVVLAGPDAHIAALGSGVTEAGDVSIAAGWSAPVQRIQSTPTLDPERRTWSSVHVFPERWIVEANPGDTGRAMDAIRRLLRGRMPPERFDLLASAAPEDTRMVTALWGPRALNMSSVGMSLGGLLAPTPVTYDGLDPGTVARATLENIAFALRECMGLIKDVCDGDEAPVVALNGGMGNSAVFAQMLANVLNAPVRRHGSGATAVGAAIVATLPVDAWRQAAATLAEQATTATPSPGAAREADEAYERWLHIRARLDELADEI